ncbi:2S seed storage protein-like [Solanum dulcamara]|uniref:2S seed storage protein-like n=1 Tax=Solanum dulcamara TaxID=45834 RepID=UPI002484E9E6|nr:2S seed storage protein-like [Solanum dulcamara]
MGKISLVAAIGLSFMLCLLAVTANKFTVTVTATEDDIENQESQSCQEQIQGHRLNHCRMLLPRSGQYYGDGLSMVTEDDEMHNQGQEHLQQCCQELRNIVTKCRCPALKTIVTPGAQAHVTESSVSPPRMQH